MATAMMSKHNEETKRMENSHQTTQTNGQGGGYTSECGNDTERMTTEVRNSISTNTKELSCSLRPTQLAYQIHYTLHTFYITSSSVSTVTRQWLRTMAKVLHLLTPIRVQLASY
jgi:hypothetical protein